MARKAHRQGDKIEGTKGDEVRSIRKKSRAASYSRLSGREKGDSIAHQKAVIREYVKEQEDIQIVLELEDCNRSGTNFCRPGFLALIEAIKKGNIDCVIVKDLSRFGRNLHEVSEYLELIFPRLGVRLISVLDGYDSENPDCLNEMFLLQMKCLIHERYAKDISLKIHTTVELMQNNGRIFGSVPYGYRREGREGIIVTEAAEGVRLIYQLALTGMGNQAVASELNRQGYATPLEYRRTGILRKEERLEKLCLTECDVEKRDITGSRWQGSSVGRILENVAYIGRRVCHRSTQCFYRGEKRQNVEREHWIYLDHAYPAIIEKDSFERVQKMRHRNRNI